MPLIIVAEKGAPPEPQLVPVATVIQKARDLGKPKAAAEQSVAITLSNMRTDVSKLYFKPVPPRNLSFDTGTMYLTLTQEMFVSELLSPCAQRKWIAHENGHVNDNQNIVSQQMEGAIRADELLADILIRKEPFPDVSLPVTNKTIINQVVTIFRQLDFKAIIARDARVEYVRVARDILQNCPETYIYEVYAGDTLGIIADYFYGRVDAWKSIYRENKGVIGRDPNKIVPGQLLRIPRKP